MAKNFDLTSPQWLELVFKGKNREYGAYVMRRNSSNRHIWAMAITVLLVSGMMFLPGLFKSKASAGTVEPLGISNAVIFEGIDQQEEVEKPVEPIVVPPDPPMKAVIKLTPPVVAPDEMVDPEELMTTQRELTDSGLDISIVNNPNGVREGGVDPGEFVKQAEIAPIVEKKPTVHDRAEQMPMFPGGNDELYRWLSQNLVYPPIAAERGMQGTVVLRFVVTDNGSIGEVQIARGVDRDLDKEALRVVGKLPKFIPGRQNGQAVSVWFTLPVKFKLN